MTTITKLSPTPKSNDRTTVTFDDVGPIELSDTVVANLGWRMGQEIDEDGMTAAGEAERAYQALQGALAYLGPRMRSRQEVVRYLRRKRHDEAAIENAIRRLMALGLINDAEYAARWVAARARPDAGRPIGRRRLRDDLAAKGVAKSEIGDALESVSDEDEEALAFAAARKKIKVVPADAETVLAERRRLAAFLQRRGFSWPVVKKVLEAVLGDAEDDAADGE